jgi:PadR family transcriptional regulator PadR
MDLTQMLKGVLPLTVLAILAEGDAYGYDVLNQLRTAGLSGVGDASVYGSLQRLYDAGLLSSYMAASATGPNRRYYSLTTSGTAALKQARADWPAFRDTVDRLLDPDAVGA